MHFLNEQHELPALRVGQIQLRGNRVVSHGESAIVLKLQLVEARLLRSRERLLKEGGQLLLGLLAIGL